MMAVKGVDFMENKKIIIYHGSVVVIEHPEYGKGKPYNDYGLGFYCTESLDLAREWAVGVSTDGYANKYEIDLAGLKVLNLSETATVLHWITVLLQNRVFNLKSDISKVGRQFLIEHYSLPIADYDVIRGYRADDSYFAYAESFLNNTISVQRLSEALRTAVYYPLRQERNTNARKEFLTNRRGTVSPDDLYLNDIMRGVSQDDPRIQ